MAFRATVKEKARTLPGKAFGTDTYHQSLHCAVPAGRAFLPSETLAIQSHDNPAVG